MVLYNWKENMPTSSEFYSINQADYRCFLQSVWVMPCPVGWSDLWRITSCCAKLFFFRSALWLRKNQCLFYSTVRQALNFPPALLNSEWWVHGGIINMERATGGGGWILLRRVYNVHYIEQKNCTARFATGAIWEIPD